MDDFMALFDDETREHLEKSAQAEVVSKIAAAYEVDVGELTEEQVSALYDQMNDMGLLEGEEKTAEVDEEAPKETVEEDGITEELDIEKVAESYIDAGRLMARGFAAEMEGAEETEKEAGSFKELLEAAIAKAKGLATGARVRSGANLSPRQFARKGWSPAEIAMAAGIPVAGAGAYALGRKGGKKSARKEKLAAIDVLASAQADAIEERAAELLQLLSQDEAPEETTKEAEVFQGAVNGRALEVLQKRGYDLEKLNGLFEAFEQE